MKVILAKPRGFCAGVVRAIEIVERALEKYGPPVYVRHEIVHNRFVVERLKARGAYLSRTSPKSAQRRDNFQCPRGLQKSKRKPNRAICPCHATCPLVTKVHISASAKSARAEAFHRSCRTSGGRRYYGPDVGAGEIGGDEADVVKLWYRPYAGRLFTQTTCRLTIRRHHRRVAQTLHRDPRTETRDICYATQNRQNAVRELSRGSISSWWSAPRTAPIPIACAKSARRPCGKPSYLIADGSELDSTWFENVQTVGITAGASAPEVLVEDVIDALRRLNPVDVSQLHGRHETIEFRLPPELTDGVTAGRVTAKV